MDQCRMAIAATPRALFSVKRIRSDYTGPLFRVSFGSEEKDVFSDRGSGREKLAVSIWYDQSGNGRHATQPDMTRRPFLVCEPGGVLKMDFKFKRFFMLPDKTIPAGDSPFTILLKHLEITNPIGGIIGSGEYAAHNAVNAIRRAGDTYVNYFWGNDLGTGPHTFKEGNVLAFAITHKGRHTGYINGILKARRNDVTGRFSSPINTTIGKTYSENEYLDGSLEFLYIMDEMATEWVTLDTGTFGFKP